MKPSNICLLIAAFALLAGCATKARSISNSGYRDDDHPAYFAPRINGSDPGFTYRGELSEFDVLGITRGQVTSEQDIQRALDNAKTVKLNANSCLSQR